MFCNIHQILSGPKTFLHVSSVFFWSLIGNFLSFFLLSPTLWLGILFLFLLSPTLWLGIFLFIVFFRVQGLTFSPWVKVYDKLGFLEFSFCQGLASGSGIKGTSHIISMIHMQQRWLGNFMQNWSCMHPCGHSSIKFLWSCDTRAQDSFSLF